MATEFIARNGLIVVSGQIQGTLASGIVISGSIASGQVSNFKLSSGAVIANLQSGSITSGLLANNSVISGSIGLAQIGRMHLSGPDGAGYFGGGLTGSQGLPTVDKLKYSNDVTAAQTSANLSAGRSYLSGVSDQSSKGYFVGGTGNTSTAEKLVYSNDTTASQTSANLSQGRDSLAGVSGEGTKGYFAGGYTNTAVVTTDKLTYSNDTTAAQTTANLSQGRYGCAGVSNRATKGYVAGGNQNPGFSAIADKITYTTDTTAAQTTANLTVQTQYLAGVSGEGQKGYFGGGDTGGYTTLAHKITYSNDTTTTQTTANLSQGRRELAGSTEGYVKGYFAGGYTGSLAGVATADKLTYSSDTTAAQTTANLSQARIALAGIEKITQFPVNSGHFADSSILSGMILSGQICNFHLGSGSIGSGSLSSGAIYGFVIYGDIGFFAGGNTGARVATTDKVTYSTDTTAAQTSANLSQARSDLGGCSGEGTKGYFAGGYTGAVVATTDRINYSNSVTSLQLAANLTTAKYSFASITQSSTQGYFAGGNTGAIVATTDKITYSSDTTAAQTSANLTQARFGLAGCSGEGTKGYFVGGLTSSALGGLVAVADKITYSNDTTAAQTSANLSQARGYLTGITEGITKGYFAGGLTDLNTPYFSNPSAVTTDKITFSTDTTAAQTTANLSLARRGMGGASSIKTKGYFGGGDTFSPSYVATSDKLTYSNDTTAAQTTANLSQARGYLAGVDGSFRYDDLIIGSGGVVSGTILSGNIGFSHLGNEVYNIDYKANNFRLGVVSGLPVSSGNLTSQTTIYLNPYNGNSISLFNGSDWDIYTTSGTSVSIATTAMASGSVYDVYCYNNAGVPALELSAAWTNINSRADSIQYVNGVPLKSGNQTRRFIGTVWGRNSGVVDDSRQYRGVWNWDNRVTTLLDATNASGHTYASSTPRAWNNNSGIAIYWIQGFGGLGAQASLFTGIYRATGAATTYAVVNGVSNAANNQIQVASLASGAAATEYKHAAGWLQCIPGLNWMYVNESVNASGSIGGQDIRINANVEA